MINHFEDFTAIRDKLNAILEDKEIAAVFDYQHFPMQMNIVPRKPDQANFFDEEEETEKKEKAPSKITLTFNINAVEIVMQGDMTLSETTLNKIKAMGKKLHYTFLQEYVALLMKNGHEVKTIEDLNNNGV